MSAWTTRSCADLGCLPTPRPKKANQRKEADLSQLPQGPFNSSDIVLTPRDCYIVLYNSFSFSSDVNMQYSVSMKICLNKPPTKLEAIHVWKHSEHRVATATLWRTFHHDGKISPAWWVWGVHAFPLHSIYHHQLWYIRSSWEGRFTPPISPLPLYELCGFGKIRYLSQDHVPKTVWISRRTLN
jgi:hypothetical protein